MKDWKGPQKADADIQIMKRYVGERLLPSRPIRKSLLWKKLQLIKGVMQRKVIYTLMRYVSMPYRKVSGALKEVP